MKQFFLPLTEPVGAVWALMLIGTVWMLIRKQWKSVAWLAVPTLLLFVMGSTPLVETLVRGEEGQWRDYTLRGLRTTDPKKGTMRPLDHGTMGLQKGPEKTTDYGLRTNGTEEVPGSQSQVPSQERAAPAAPASVAPPSDRPASNAPAADVVVVLGGGVRMSHFDGHGFAADDAFTRIMAGIQLVRCGLARDLVLGGSYPTPGKPEQPGMMAVEEWIEKWGLAEKAEGGRTEGGTATAEGSKSYSPVVLSSQSPIVPSCEITNLGICLDTHDEAVAFKKLKQFKDWNSVMLVTSALHMRRAKLLFEHMGIKVQPVAADFEVYGVSQDLPFSIFPRMHRLWLWTLYMHEKIGMVVYGRRGWI